MYLFFQLGVFFEVVEARGDTCSEGKYTVPEVIRVCCVERLETRIWVPTVPWSPV